jgi:hypothetical protein
MAEAKRSRLWAPCAGSSIVVNLCVCEKKIPTPMTERVITATIEVMIRNIFIRIDTLLPYHDRDL